VVLIIFVSKAIKTQLKVSKIQKPYVTTSERRRVKGITDRGKVPFPIKSLGGEPLEKGSKGGRSGNALQNEG